MIVSNIGLIGCSTTHVSSVKVDWPDPEKPMEKEVTTIPVYKGKQFIPNEDGIFMNKQNASNLIFNINELDSHIKKQNKLIESMKSFYGDK